MPADWLKKHFHDATAQQHYREKHLLGDIPAELQGFETFLNARKERLRTKMLAMLCDTAVAADAGGLATA